MYGYYFLLVVVVLGILLGEVEWVQTPNSSSTRFRYGVYRIE